jgi:hypothetical protein
VGFKEKRMKRILIVALLLTSAVPVFALETSDETPGWQQEASWKRERRQTQALDMPLLLQVFLRIALSAASHKEVA